MSDNSKAPVVTLLKVDSTNTYLKKLSSSTTLEEGTVVIANEQLNGKGQGNKNWESEPNKNLLFSIYLNPTRKGNLYVLNMLIAVALCRICKQLVKAHPVSVKWPNDIIVNSQKIAGILIENVIGSKGNIKSFIGIGLNVNQSHFKNTSRPATSLFNLTGKTTLINELAQCLQQEILQLYAQKNWNFIIEEYNQLLFAKNQEDLFEFKGEILFQKKYWVNSNGLLFIEQTNGILQSFQHGELVFRY